MSAAILPALPADEGPDPANCVLCGLTGPGCPYHGGSRGQ